MATAETKDRILDAAEALFARQGFSATSVRNVIAEAGVNLAAVHYHFGSREELIRAVFARRFEALNEERLGLLRAFEEDTASATREDRLEAILGILVGPLLRAARSQEGAWSQVGLLVGRVHTEPDFAIRRLLHDQFAEVSVRFAAAISACVPWVDAEELLYRFHFVIAAMAVSLVHLDDIRALSDGRIDPGRDPDLFGQRWIAFAAAGLRAAGTAPSSVVQSAGGGEHGAGEAGVAGPHDPAEEEGR